MLFRMLNLGLKDLLVRIKIEDTNIPPVSNLEMYSRNH